MAGRGGARLGKARQGFSSTRGDAMDEGELKRLHFKNEGIATLTDEIDELRSLARVHKKIGEGADISQFRLIGVALMTLAIMLEDRQREAKEMGSE